MSATEWVMVSIVVNKAADSLGCYLNGEIVIDATGLGTWTPGVQLFATTTVIGASNTSAAAPWLVANLARFALWSAALSAAEVLALVSSTRTVRRVLFVGDSKTEGDTWTWLLRQQLLDDDEIVYHNISDAYAVGGWTIAEAKTYIDANLSSVTGGCNVVLINLGSNGSETENDFKTDYRAVIEAFHAKWSTASIYLARPVLLNASPPSTPTSANATKRGWIDDLVAEYAYVYAGIDETSLEGGDGYATNLTDTTHYSTAGQTAVKTLWAAIL